MFKYYRSHLAEDLDRAEYTPLLERIAHEGCEIKTYLKNQPASTVWPLEMGSRDLVIKRYNTQGFIHACKRAFRRSRAENCYAISRRFTEAGIEVAKPLAVIQEWWGPIRLRSWYICEQVQGEMLRDLCAEWTHENSHEKEIEALATEIKKMFSSLREYRLSHGDLKASNIIWWKGKLFLIDLDTARTHSRNSVFDRAHARDQSRFMRNWRDLPVARQLFESLIK